MSFLTKFLCISFLLIESSSIFASCYGRGATGVTCGPSENGEIIKLVIYPTCHARKLSIEFENGEKEPRLSFQGTINNFYAYGELYNYKFETKNGIGYLYADRKKYVLNYCK